MFVQHLILLTSFLSHRFLQFTWCQLPLWKNFAPWKGATSLSLALCFLLQHFLGFFFQALFFWRGSGAGFHSPGTWGALMGSVAGVSGLADAWSSQSDSQSILVAVYQLPGGFESFFSFPMVCNGWCSKWQAVSPQCRLWQNSLSTERLSKTSCPSVFFQVS